MRNEDLKVEYVHPDALKEYEGNAKRHTNEQIDAIEASLKEFGFRNPILAWHNDAGDAEIVAGHARLKAAKAVGMDSVPVIFVDDLSDAQRRALTLVDNQTTMMTGWDFGALESELGDLSYSFDMGDFGFDVSDIESLDDIFDAPPEQEDSGGKRTITCPECGYEFEY